MAPTSAPIDSVENPETHEDLVFVFEQSDLNDGEDEAPDLHSAEPLMFHHNAGESDPEVLQGIMNRVNIRKLKTSFSNFVYFLQVRFILVAPNSQFCCGIITCEC